MKAAMLISLLLTGSAGAEVSLRSGPVQASSRYVRLSDIARIRPDSESMSRIVVGVVEDGPVFLTRDALRRRLSVAGLRAEISGPSFVKVLPPGRPIAGNTLSRPSGDASPASPASVVGALETAVLADLQAAPEEVSLEPDGINCWGENGGIPPETLSSIRVEAVGGNPEVKWARFTARTASGERVHGWARFKVKQRIRAVVAKVSLRRGELITPSKIETREMLVPPGRFDGFRNPDAVAGRHAARDIRAGTFIRIPDVKRRIVIRRGATVTATVDGPGFQLSDRVVALTDAETGEIIRVKNPRSGETFRAKVISERLVVPVD